MMLDLPLFDLDAHRFSLPIRIDLERAQKVESVADTWAVRILEFVAPDLDDNH